MTNDLERRVAEFAAKAEAQVIPYYIALGRFLSAYSRLESLAQATLWLCARVTPAVGKSLFSGTRISEAINLMKRIADSEEWHKERRANIDIVSDQLGEITRTRNDILHYGTERMGLEWYTTNALVAHTADRIRETRITPEILDDMTHDLDKMAAHLVQVETTADPSWFKVAGPVLRSSWRYRREPPSHRQNTHRHEPNQEPPDRP